MDIPVAKAKEKRIEQLRALLEELGAVDVNCDFKQINLQTSVIRDPKRIEEISKSAFEKGSHIYYFTVNDGKTLGDQYNTETLNKDYKYAKYNKIIVERDAKNSCVYVGSCSKIKLADRFLQHCGHKARSTYSLQLARWLDKDVELNFTFYYVHVDTSPEVLQQLEEGLRSLLNPMFGKAGPNNKA
ncbi:MAG: hypothetical protein EAZ91_04500 [Cytophagales bacterium]|nr:MAG: hypothetical protein EAZ91_04500 [Cytophagales bacterium]